jgi:hypothetical protein
MSKKRIKLIIISQEYEEANHINLWSSLAKLSHDSYLIINIPSDLVVTLFRLKFQRLIESIHKPKKVSDNLTLFRPFFIIRPEISPSFLYKYISNQLISYIQNIYRTKNISLEVLFYDPIWAKILKENKYIDKLNYFIIDEYHLFAHSGKENKQKKKNDLFACKISDKIFTISDGLAQNRKEFGDKINVIGNGANFVNLRRKPPIKFTVGFIGIFRNWIDKDLYEYCVSDNPNFDFLVIGKIEHNMLSFVNKLKKKYSNFNTKGFVEKNKISDLFNNVSIVIVPYIENNFTKLTRPIKIVESIFNFVPIISIPVSGYSEKGFLKFVSGKKNFSNAIKDFYSYSIDKNSNEFQIFIKENSWENVAKKLLIYF